MAAQLGTEKTITTPGIPEEFEHASDDDEPDFVPQNKKMVPQNKKMPNFLSKIEAETQKQLKKALSEAVEANENKLTTEISENIAKKFEITLEQVKEYYDFLYPSPSSLVETGGVDEVATPSGVPGSISRGETGPGDGVELGSRMIEGSTETEDIFETEETVDDIGGPSPLIAQVTGGANECIFGNEGEEPFMKNLEPRGMTKKVTLNDDSIFGETISEHIEKDLDDYDAPSFTPKKNTTTFTMAPPIMSAARTGFNSEDEDEESIEEVIEADKDDPDEPAFSLGKNDEII